MTDALPLPHFIAAERRDLDIARAKAKARLGDELKVCWESCFNKGEEKLTRSNRCEPKMFFSPFVEYAAAMYESFGAVLLKRSVDQSTYANWLTFAAKTCVIEGEGIVPHWSLLGNIGTQVEKGTLPDFSGSMWEEMMGYSWRLFRHPNKSALESQAYRLIFALRDPLGGIRDALLTDIHSSISEKTLHLLAKGLEYSRNQLDSAQVEDYGQLTPDLDQVNKNNLKHNIESLKNDVEILATAAGFAAARNVYFKATEPIFRELEQGADRNQAIRLFDESAKAMLELVCSRKTRDAYLKVLDFVYYPEAHRYLTGGCPEGYARFFGGSFVRDICAEWRETVNELNARKRFWVNEAFKRCGDVNSTETSVLLEDKALPRPIEIAEVASKLVLEQSEKDGSEIKPLIAPERALSFQSRARWLKRQLDERSWNKHDLSRMGGPDNKTIQKILDGVSVRGDVLEKVADGLSKKGQKVEALDIPLD